MFSRNAGLSVDQPAVGARDRDLWDCHQWRGLEVLSASGGWIGVRIAVIATAKAVRTLASRCAQSHHVKNQTDRDIYESDFLTMTNIAQSC